MKAKQLAALRTFNATYQDSEWMQRLAGDWADNMEMLTDEDSLYLAWVAEASFRAGCRVAQVAASSGEGRSRIAFKQALRKATADFRAMLDEG